MLTVLRGAGEQAVAAQLEERGWNVEPLYLRRQDPPDLIARKNDVKWGLEVKTCDVSRAGAASRPGESVDFQFKSKEWIRSDFFVLCIQRDDEIKIFFVMRKEEAPIGPIVKVTHRVRFFLDEERLRYPDWAQHLNRFDKLES